MIRSARHDLRHWMTRPHGFHGMIGVAIFFGLIFSSCDVALRNDTESGRSTNRQLQSHMEMHSKASVTCNDCHQIDNQINDSNDIDPEDKGKFEPGFILAPGSRLDSTNTCAKCHPVQARHVGGSLMNTMHGAIVTTRFAMGPGDTRRKEKPEGVSPVQVSELQPEQSLADDYFRDLCTNCHLNHTPMINKESLDQVDQIYFPQDPMRNATLRNIHNRGGGCLACHLSDFDGRTVALQLKKPLPQKKEAFDGSYREKSSPGPQTFISRSPPVHSCTGCHSGSARISLTYYGLHEVFADESTRQATPQQNRRNGIVRSGNRFFRAVEPDVHAKAGMACTDCHGRKDTMGDGKFYSHKDQAVHTKCQDCHADHPDTVAMDSHRRLSCDACHAEQAPRCTGCHIRKEKSGQWVEFRKEAGFDKFSLGVQGNAIRPFIPAMIFSFDTKIRSKEDPLFPKTTSGKVSGDIVFRDLYAPVFAHSIRKHARSCESCHSDPIVYGAGKGKLTESSRGSGEYAFHSEYSIQRGKPEDAWFALQDYINGDARYLRYPRYPGHKNRGTLPQSTRNNARPLEQKTIRAMLRVASCLECHEPEKKIFPAEYAKLNRQEQERRFRKDHPEEIAFPYVSVASEK